MSWRSRVMCQVATKSTNVNQFETKSHIFSVSIKIRQRHSILYSRYPDSSARPTPLTCARSVLSTMHSDNWSLDDACRFTERSEASNDGNASWIDVYVFSRVARFAAIRWNTGG